MSEVSKPHSVRDDFATLWNIGLGPDGNDALQRIEEQLEAAQGALREIASYTSSRNINDDFGKFANDRVQEIALLGLANSNPASGPRTIAERAAEFVSNQDMRTHE